jgi:hypothetical protein
MSKRRKAGEWVRLAACSGFCSESDRLPAEIGTDGSAPCMLGCDDPECVEWVTLHTAPDPEHGGQRHMLCHVSECQMFDLGEAEGVGAPSDGAAHPAGREVQDLIDAIETYQACLLRSVEAQGLPMPAPGVQKVRADLDRATEALRDAKRRAATSADPIRHALREALRLYPNEFVFRTVGGARWEAAAMLAALDRADPVAEDFVRAMAAAALQAVGLDAALGGGEDTLPKRGQECFDQRVPDASKRYPDGWPVRADDAFAEQIFVAMMGGERCASVACPGGFGSLQEHDRDDYRCAATTARDYVASLCEARADGWRRTARTCTDTLDELRAVCHAKEAHEIADAVWNLRDVRGLAPGDEQGSPSLPGTEAGRAERDLVIERVRAVCAERQVGSETLAEIENAIREACATREEAS